MLCWGSREISEYVRSGLVPEEFFTVGSLKLSLAKRRNTNGQAKKWDICIVSQYRPMPADPNRVSELNRFEAQSMLELIRLLRPIIVRNHLRVIVAVKAGRRIYESSLEQQEIAFYQSVMGDIAEIGLSRNPYASYALAESSKLVIGRNSALLTEMLGSQSRVLFVNPTEQAMFNASDDMPYKLITPSATELEATVLGMLNESSDEYARKVEFVIRKYCVRMDDTFAEVGRALGLSQ
jgi:surface carbohydrate biosynthesis protein